MSLTTEERFTYGDADVRRAVSITVDRMLAQRQGQASLVYGLSILERVARRALGVERQGDYGSALSNAVHDLQVAGRL